MVWLGGSMIWDVVRWVWVHMWGDNRNNNNRLDICWAGPWGVITTTSWEWHLCVVVIVWCWLVPKVIVWVIMLVVNNLYLLLRW